LPEKQKFKDCIANWQFFFSGESGKMQKSVQGARLYIDIGVHLALNKFEYQELVYSQKIFRFVPEQLSRKAKSLDSQNWTEIRYEIGTILIMDFRK